MAALDVVSAEFRHSYLVAPKLGTSVSLDSVELRALAILRGRDPGGDPPQVDAVADQVMAELAEIGHHVREDNKLVTDPDEARPIVIKRVERALRLHITVLPALGVEV